GSFFTDREQELGDLVSDALSGQNVVIISPRRYGKTSLVMNARTRLVSEGAMVGYVDLLKVSSLKELVDELATSIHNGIFAPLQRVKREVSEAFAQLPVKPSFKLSADGSWSVELGVSDRPRDVEDVLEQLLALPQQVATDRKRRVVLVLDEFQQV